LLLKYGEDSFTEFDRLYTTFPIKEWFWFDKLKIDISVVFDGNNSLLIWNSLIQKFIGIINLKFDQIKSDNPVKKRTPSQHLFKFIFFQGHLQRD
jgi:hypothetical protein